MGEEGRTRKQQYFIGIRATRLAGCALTPFLLWSGIGCGLTPSGKTKEVIKECIVPADQKDTLAGKWKTLAIPLAFHQGDFTPEETAAMTAAADTWNKFYTASQGLTVLDYGGTSVRTSTAAVPTNTCSQGLLQGGKFTGQVVIYKQKRWPHPGTLNSTIALTNFCTTPSTPLPSTYMAYMEINYQGFFYEGGKVPDLQTIVAHELGHLLGLYHSCDANPDKAGKPNCSKSGLDPSYSEALMFPVFGFNDDLTGEQKREIYANDQGRANCLYSASSATSTTTTSTSTTK